MSRNESCVSDANGTIENPKEIVNKIIGKTIYNIEFGVLTF